jgi:dihydrofolate reductase
MTLAIVVAASLNNAIGKDNRLLWSLPNDMKFFKNTTWAMPVIMGRKTFESLGKPLPGRLNIVITRQADWQQEGAAQAGSLQEAIQVAKGEHFREAYVIGGGEIYREALPLTDTIYLTRVETVVDADTFFPEIDDKLWKLSYSQSFAADEKHAYPYRFETWVRQAS